MGGPEWKVHIFLWDGGSIIFYDECKNEAPHFQWDGWSIYQNTVRLNLVMLQFNGKID